MSPSVPRLLDRPLTSYYLLLSSVTMLLILGLVMVYSASSVMSIADSGSSLTIFRKQLLWVVLGIPLAWLCTRFPVRVWRALAYPAIFGSLLLLLLVLVPGLGVSVNGNQNWLDLGGPFRLQPSEAAKLALVLWGADLLARKQALLTEWRHLLVPLLPVAGLIIFLVLLGGDLGTALILVVITASLLFFVGAPLRLFVALGGATVGLVVMMSLTAPHRMSRLTSWLDPEADALDTGWQAIQGKYALASGNWFGVGLGASREKWGALPEAHTDFIFAIIGEELGLMGTLIVLVLFAAIVFAGLRIAVQAEDSFVRLAAAAATAWLGFQALVNIGAVVGLLPITGVPLPLISYGGSALLPTLVALGMLLSFARSTPQAAAALAARPGLRQRLSAP